jgi:hypothetical protein
MNTRSAAFTVAASAIAALTVLASGHKVEAASDFPFARLRTSIHELFSPPRRVRRARPKQAGIAEQSRARAARTAARTAAKTEAEQQSKSAAPAPEPAPRRRAARRKPEPALAAPAPSARAERAVRQPRPRPLEAPPGPKQTATPKDRPAEPRSRRAAARARTAALPPANQGPADEAEPSPDPVTTAHPPTPSACQLRLTPDLAAVQLLPPISAGQCVVDDLVRLNTVTGRDGRRIAIAPPATLRCPMAEAVIHWVRDDVAPVALDLGAALKSVGVDTSFECRSQNRVAGAKLSEHGHANAIDLRGVTLANGATVVFTDPAVRREARERLRQAACARFTTVLGPGSDGYHENHIHLDLRERRHGYRLCQWDVRDPTVVASVPFPPERPSSAPPRSAAR